MKFSSSRVVLPPPLTRDGATGIASTFNPCAPEYYQFKLFSRLETLGSSCFVFCCMFHTPKWGGCWCRARAFKIMFFFTPFTRCNFDLVMGGCWCRAKAFKNMYSFSPAIESGVGSTLVDCRSGIGVHKCNLLGNRRDGEVTPLYGSRIRCCDGYPWTTVRLAYVECELKLCIANDRFQMVLFLFRQILNSMAFRNLSKNFDMSRFQADENDQPKPQPTGIYGVADIIARAQKYSTTGMFMLCKNYNMTIFKSNCYIFKNLVILDPVPPQPTVESSSEESESTPEQGRNGDESFHSVEPEGISIANNSSRKRDNASKARVPQPKKKLINVLEADAESASNNAIVLVSRAKSMIDKARVKDYVEVIHALNSITGLKVISNRHAHQQPISTCFGSKLITYSSFSLIGVGDEESLSMIITAFSHIGLQTQARMLEDIRAVTYRVTGWEARGIPEEKRREVCQNYINNFLTFHSRHMESFRVLSVKYEMIAIEVNADEKSSGSNHESVDMQTGALVEEQVHVGTLIVRGILKMSQPNTYVKTFSVPTIDGESSRFTKEMTKEQKEKIRKYFSATSLTFSMELGKNRKSGKALTEVTKDMYRFSKNVLFFETELINKCAFLRILFDTSLFLEHFLKTYLATACGVACWVTRFMNVYEATKVYSLAFPVISKSVRWSRPLWKMALRWNRVVLPCLLLEKRNVALPGRLIGSYEFQIRKNFLKLKRLKSLRRSQRRRRRRRFLRKHPKLKTSFWNCSRKRGRKILTRISDKLLRLLSRWLVRPESDIVTDNFFAILYQEILHFPKCSRKSSKFAFFRNEKDIGEFRLGMALSSCESTTAVLNIGNNSKVARICARYFYIHDHG